MAETPRRGEIWLLDFGQPVGHEAGFTRPALVVSDDSANLHGLAVCCLIGTASRNYPTRVEVEPGTSGLDDVSYVQVEQIRTTSSNRLVRRLGTSNVTVMNHVEHVLRFLLRV